MAKVSVRNLTVHPLELVRLERFNAERVDNRSGGFLANATASISNFVNATDTPSHKHVPQGEPKVKRDLSLRVPPFQTRESDINAINKDTEVLRLTLKAEGGKRFQTDIPSETSRSAVMKKLDGGPHDLTAVFVPSRQLLAIFSSAKLHAWMGELDDDWPLALLSMPGTHNSPTCHTALPSVRCQAVGVEEQLRNGVRFLDIRVSANPGDNQDLALVHSAFPISLTGNKYFGDMLETIYKFLDENPSETVVMSVKREGTGKGTDQDLSRHLKHGYVDKRANRWYVDAKVPKLGQARGRIVLIRRYALGNMVTKERDGKGYGIDALAWPDNCEDGRVGGGHIRVQDFYEISETQNIEKKIAYSRGQLERAAEQVFRIAGMPDHKPDIPIPPMFVNFLSASNFFNATCWPERIAAKVNPAIIEYLCDCHGAEGKGPKKLKVGSAGTGIVVTDWVGANDDWDLVRCIVGMNARLQYRQEH
jgi:1-phosphatidylinositol phosphodiesterase